MESEGVSVSFRGAMGSHGHLKGSGASQRASEAFKRISEALRGASWSFREVSGVLQGDSKVSQPLERLRVS